MVVEGSQEALDAYDEGDEIVTEFVEPVPDEPRWLVQVTPFDRRSMSREHLLAELRSGALVGAETLVWRSGMRNWATLARVGELSAPEATHPPGGPSEPEAPSAGRMENDPVPSAAAVVLASSAASALAIGVTLALLAWAGAFEAATPPSERAHPYPRAHEPSGPRLAPRAPSARAGP